LTVKKCKVVNSNACNTVVEFDGVGKIQLPTPNVSSDYVYVKEENKRYSICTEDEYQDFTNKEKKASNENALDIKEEDLELGIVEEKKNVRKTRATKAK